MPTTKPEKPAAQRLREAVFCVCAEFRLTREERLEVAAYVLGREVESFNDLDPKELARMRDAMEGAKYVASICIDRRKGDRIQPPLR